MTHAPIDPSFHPAYGHPPIEPHRLVLKGGTHEGEGEGEPYDHFTGSCTRCSWTGEAIGVQAVREYVTADFLRWHHIDPAYIDIHALEGTFPAQRRPPLIRLPGDAIFVGGLILAVAAPQVGGTVGFICTLTAILVMLSTVISLRRYPS